MVDEILLKRLEGLQTVETVMKELGIKRQSAINLASRLKKLGYLSLWLGGKKKIYKITTRKQRPRDKGMFDIINKYSPMKLQPWYDHQVHGKYEVEDALIDAIETKSFRVILASLMLFNHIKDWPKLYNLAKKKDCWQKAGALYDVAKLFFRVKRMPEKYLHNKFNIKKFLIGDYKTKETIFNPIEKKWNVAVPFRIGDIHKVKYDIT